MASIKMQVYHHDVEDIFARSIVVSYIQDMSWLEESDVPTHFVFCNHPLSAVQAIAEATGITITESEFREAWGTVSKGRDKGQVNWQASGDLSNPTVIQGHHFYFMWYCTGGHDMLAWFNFIYQNVKRSDARKIMDLSSQQFE